jgi:hypothetical protein
MLGPLNGVRAAAGARPVHNPDELLRRAPLMLIGAGEQFEDPHRGLSRGACGCLELAALDPPLRRAQPE